MADYEHTTTPEKLAHTLYTNAFSQGFYKNAAILGSSPLSGELEKSLKELRIKVVPITPNPAKETRVINLDKIKLV